MIPQQYRGDEGYAVTTKVQPELLDSNSQALFTLTNVLINGGMRVDARNGGSSIAVTSASVFPVDRWRAGMATANGTGQRVASTLDNFPYKLRLTGGSGTTTVWVGQYIESFNCTPLIGKTVTVSFYMAASAITSVTATIKRANAADDFTGTTTVESKTQAITSTLTRYSLTFAALPSTVANGIYLEFVGGSNLDTGTLDITGVQLVAGSVDIPYIHRHYQQEVALCQRYYYKANALPLGVTLNTADGYSALVHFPVQMRANPTLESGASFSVGSGSAGTPSISGTNGEAARISNSANNWTSNVTVSLTAGFTAELS